MIRLKTEEQIDRIRESCHLLYHTFEHLKKAITPGISTWDIDKIAEEYIVKNGGLPAFKGVPGPPGVIDFPATVCTSVNEGVIHGIPSKKMILKEGDIVSCDIGINLGGYISDSAYTFGVGKISEELDKLLKVTEEALYIGIEACKAGKRIKDIGKAINNYIDQFGYGIVYEFCGHGVGFDVHEEPQIPNYYPSSGRNPRIKPGMVLAIEPMINLGVDDVDYLDDGWTIVTADRKPSAHFEHTVAVFPDHTEILTKVP